MALNALFTGSAALQSNSTALDVVGNNLANINTTGFKSQRTLFRDMVYQTLSPGSGANGTSGGTNPVQLGFGVGVGSVDTQFSQGAINPTGRALDMAIQGKGFFTVSDGSRNLFSRSGSFAVDSSGFLVDPNTGFRVQRFGAVGEPSGTQPGFQVAGDTNVKVPFGAGAQGVPTQNVNYQGNLSSGLAVDQSATTAIQIFDAQGSSRTLTVTFTKSATNAFTVSADVSGATVALSATSLTFDNKGLLTSPETIDVTISGITGVADQTITLNLGTAGQATGLTQFGGVSTATAINQDGSPSGTLTSVSVDQAGVLVGQFSNGLTLPLAQLAIAAFNNETGLVREGNNYFSASPASGQALTGVAGAGGRGIVQGSALEGANVDIAIEFSRLIIAQRGFQVNARTITVANETLQELANIVR